MKTVSINIDKQLARKLRELSVRWYRTSPKESNDKRSFLRSFVEDRITEEIQFLSDPTSRTRNLRRDSAEPWLDW
jgi:hypothetical protein